MIDHKELMRQGADLIATNLAECCREELEWQNTALLCNGKMREAGAIYSQVDSAHALSIVQSEVARQAMQVVAAAPQVVADEADLECQIPPFGWRCTRGAGHPGPCAAVECPEDVAAVKRGMARLAAAPVQAQELSDAAIINAANKYGISPHAAMPFVRELIAAQSTAQEIRVVANPVEFDGIKTAPVQAQEPVPEAAQQNGGLVRAALIDLMALERQATSACDGFNAQRDCNLRFARARKALADSADTAPVQPVAVPDGHLKSSIKSVRSQERRLGSAIIGGKTIEGVGLSFMVQQLGYAVDALEKCAATPAAQGDAIEDDLTKIVKSGVEKDFPGFLEWIADRLVYVHNESNNVDYVQTLRTRAKQLRAAIAAKAAS